MIELHGFVPIALWILGGILFLLVTVEPLVKIGDVLADWIDRRFGR